jgi:hypothetical protein
VNLAPLVVGLGAIVVAALLRARAAVDQTESGGWYRDGTSPATTCVRCGRRLKRPGVRLVSTDDPTVIVAAGPSCARKLADGAVCERCEQGDLLPELPGERPECCTKPYKEWSATGWGGLTYGEAADAVYADSFYRSRSGEGKPVTVTHGRIVKTMGKRKREAYRDCLARYCQTSAHRGAYLHHFGDHYTATELPDPRPSTDPDAAVVRSRGGTATASYRGELLYSGPDLSAAVDAAADAVSDPFAPSPSSTRAGLSSSSSEVPF